MASQQWGRKETVIFPPHSAIYTYGAVFLAFVMTGCFLYVRFAYGQTLLQQFYTPMYARSAAWNARRFLYQLRSDQTGTRGAFDGTREEAYGGADLEPAAAG